MDQDPAAKYFLSTNRWLLLDWPTGYTVLRSITQFDNCDGPTNVWDDTLGLDNGHQLYKKSKNIIGLVCSSSIYASLLGWPAVPNIYIVLSITVSMKRYSISGETYPLVHIDDECRSLWPGNV